MKKYILQILYIILFLFIGNTFVFAEICENHTFAEESSGLTEYYFYSSGRSWDFTPENNLTLNSVTLYVKLAGPGNYQAHIQIKINDTVIASWDQNITTIYTYYSFTENINSDLRTGDTISFFIYGGSSSTPGGAVADGGNYLKFCGDEWIQPPPTVTVLPATSVTCSSSTLNATVNPNDNFTSYYFEYGLSNSYGSSTSIVDIGSGSDNVFISQRINGLEHNTTYHYRIVANNDSTTTSYGDDITFTTSEKCTVITPVLQLLLLSEDE